MFHTDKECNLCPVVTIKPMFIKIIYHMESTLYIWILCICLGELIRDAIFQSAGGEIKQIISKPRPRSKGKSLLDLHSLCLIHLTWTYSIQLLRKMIYYPYSFQYLLSSFLIFYFFWKPTGNYNICNCFREICPLNDY